MQLGEEALLYPSSRVVTFANFGNNNMKCRGVWFLFLRKQCLKLQNLYLINFRKSRLKNLRLKFLV